MDAIKQSIEITGTGVTVDRHVINANTFYNLDTKIMMFAIHSYIGNNEKPVKHSRAQIAIEPGENITTKIVTYVTANLSDIINGPSKDKE